ncbi:MAG TPA: SMC-Scp complex subunit ScpB [Candidatus Paceibacterota bacterium]
MNLEAKLEALLFWKGEPISKKKIEAALGCTADELATALASLEASLSTRGVRLMRIEDEVELRTSPETSDMIIKLTKEELMRDLGKAGLETLAIILYKGPIKRSEIDYIRGVNSSFIVRNLLIRGLIERVTEKEGMGRGYSYKPTIDLLAHLGVAKLEDLPDFAKVKAEMEAFAAESAEQPAPATEIKPETV